MSKIGVWPTKHYNALKFSSFKEKFNGFKISNLRPMVEEKTDERGNTLDQFKSIVYSIFTRDRIEGEVTEGLVTE